VKFAAGDAVKVQYQFGKFYTGRVLWTEDYGGLYWVTVRPDDDKFIYTFGSASDMSNGYKSYIANDPVLGRVFPV
jgi:hypothetical protein